MFRWLTGKRLRTQLVFWTALILIVSVAITTEIRIQFNIRLLEGDLQMRAETLVRAAGHTLDLAGTDVSRDTFRLRRRMREFVEADATLTRLDLMRVQTGVPPAIVASSSTEQGAIVSEIPESLSSWISSAGPSRFMITTDRIDGTDLALVAVSSLENIDNYEAYNRVIRPLFAGILVLIALSLMYLMYTRTVSTRFDELLSGIQLAKEGRIARIPDDHNDEIGTIAKTLNGLLERVHSFNEELRGQIAVATETLNKRNLALEETGREMLAMQEQLLESQRLAMVGQMAATFAHEIGSPMSSLSAHVQLLLEDPGLAEHQREELNFVRQEIQIVVQIVTELLRSARRGHADFVAIDINEILRTVVRLVQPKLMSQNIELRLDLKSIPLVRGYALYLQEAFLNILNNAIHAMPSGGWLEIASWFDEAGELVNIRIIDSGGGIDPAVVERVFDHFVTTKAIGEGSGLGLGIVKEIVEAHRGVVYVGSNNGSGTAAHIKLPVEDAALRVS